MAKDSQFYVDKDSQLRGKLTELLNQLPRYAVNYINDNIETAQLSTLVSYSYDLVIFFRFLKDANPRFKGLEIKHIPLDLLSYLSEADIKEYQTYLTTKYTNGKKSRNRKLAPVRGLFKFLKANYSEIDHDPTLSVKLAKIEKNKSITRLDNDEVLALLATVERGSEIFQKNQKKYIEKTVKRDTAIITLLLGTGIRVSECAGLDLKDIIFKDREHIGEDDNQRDHSLKIVRKGGGEDTLFFNDQIAIPLIDYIDTERKKVKANEGHQDALFLSLHKNRMSVDAIENLVKKFSEKSVPNKKITPHKLRSTYGTALYRATGDIRLVGDVLGHNDLRNTIEFYAAMEEDHKRTAASAINIKNGLKGSIPPITEKKFL